MADCPSDEQLTAWCDRKLAHLEERGIELHLIECGGCRQTAMRVCQGLAANEARLKLQNGTQVPPMQTSQPK